MRIQILELPTEYDDDQCRTPFVLVYSELNLDEYASVKNDSEGIKQRTGARSLLVHRLPIDLGPAPDAPSMKFAQVQASLEAIQAQARIAGKLPTRPSYHEDGDLVESVAKSMYDVGRQFNGLWFTWENLSESTRIAWRYRAKGELQKGESDATA